MPEQSSKRGAQVTGNLQLDQPFESAPVRFGVKGLDLKSASDQVPPDAYRRLTNVLHDMNGQLVARPGLIDLTGHTDDIHSIRRLNDPDSNTFTRIWGVGTSLGVGQSSITEVDSGYSGSPLCLVPYRPPLSGEPWMFVTDRNRVRKVRADGLDLPIGLPAPGTAPSVAVAEKEITNIAQFDTSDTTDFAQWTNNAGFDYSDIPLPTVIPETQAHLSKDGDGVAFIAQPGVNNTADPVFQAAKGYFSFWGMPLIRDLTVVGSQPATDDDLIHLWVLFTHPDLTAEFRIYFVCSETFNPSVLPGTSFNEGENSDFYVKTWRQNDFTAFLQAQTAQIEAAEVARVRAVRDQDLKNRKINDPRVDIEVRIAQQDPARTISIQAGAGRSEWVEFGVIGTPVRRGDFQRVGADATRNWGNITGIVIYLQTVNGCGGTTTVILDQCYLTGGFGPDTSEPGDQQYDYRYTHYDPRTGAEGNPSPEMSAGTFIDALRQKVTLTPTPYGADDMRQRFYRRGASLTADWYYLGVNDDDGGQFEDIFADAAIEAAGTVELDNDAFLTSVNTDGDPLYGTPAPILFGPCQDLLFALGDVNRPGDVYYCKPGQPDSWPAANHTEVTAPSEPLMNGGVFGTQAFVLSQERGYLLYPNLSTSATGVTAVPTECRKGLVGRWAMAIGHGWVWFVAEDGVYRTNGGPADPISDDLRPLFHGTSVEGYAAVDMSSASLRFLRLSIHDFDLILLYKGLDGSYCEWRYSILYQYWRPIKRNGGIAIQVAYSDEGSTDLLYGDWLLERAYTEGGFSDVGNTIDCEVRSGYTDFNRPREDKRLGDLYLDADPQGVDLTIGMRLNSEAVINTEGLLVGATGRDRYIIDPFGLIPQQARTAALQVTWTSATAAPILYQWGVSIIPQPDVTLSRVTQWEDLGHPDEVYLTGLTLDVETNTGTKSFFVEYDTAEEPHVWNTLGPYSLSHPVRHKAKFSWPVVKAQLVRIRPEGDCQPWQLYRADWIFDPEPPRIARWDINHENGWDQYITGLDLECNTFGAQKAVELYIDEDFFGQFNVLTTGRQVVHLTVQPPRRGHILRFVAVDESPGLLYSHRWHTDPEPSEQTNWNQNYSTWGYDSDKWLKAVVFQCDTFAQNKQVAVEIDHQVVEVLNVNANNRNVVEVALTEQKLGRVFRFLPIDEFPGRIYNITPVFDLEPLALTSWETQEVTAGIDGWKSALYGHITVKAPAPVTLTVTAFNQTGDTFVRTYTLPRTGTSDPQKVPLFVPFERSKGMLYKFRLTSSLPFYLYREETQVVFVPWGSDQRVPTKPFGNDDLDSSRGMGNASLQAATPGGASR